MRLPSFYGAIFALIENEKREFLFLKRKNTGYLDGWYGLPAGHIESGERISEAMIRELREEVGITVSLNGLSLTHMSHRIRSDRTYFDCYFRINSYEGIVQNAEPEKSEGIFWLDPKKGGKIQNLYALEAIERGESFSEWREE